MKRVMLALVVALVPALLFAQASPAPAGEDRSCVGSRASVAEAKAKAEQLARNGQLAAAACWYRLGVNAGDAESQTALGKLYWAGGGGLDRNPTEAMNLYMLAIKRSYPKAFFGMAEILEAAGGVNRDYAEQLREKGREAEQLQAGPVGGARPSVESGSSASKPPVTASQVRPETKDTGSVPPVIHPPNGKSAPPAPTAPAAKGTAPSAPATKTPVPAARTAPAPGLIELPPKPGVPDAPIAAPKNFVAVKSGHSVNMSWLRVDDAMAYCVFRAPNGKSGPGPERVTCTSELAFVDETAKPGTMYMYFVVAVDQSKDSSDFSNMVTIR